MTDDIANFLHQNKTLPIISKINEYVNDQIKYLLENLGDYDVILDNDI